MIDVDGLSISSAAGLIAAGELGCVELLEAVAGRLEETEPLVHAYASLRLEQAFEEARAADERGPGGALRGVPFAVKDVIWTDDLPTACGSEARRGWVAPEDAEAVRLLRSAGAILVGKHVTHEFALGQNVPPTRNPWRLGDYPGGSSAGGGVSVAVGSSLGALGTDAGGSVRKPAALNGVVGLKPTRGLVSRRGVCEPTGSLDHVGTFSRTVEDAALLLSALSTPVESGPIDLGGTRLGICRSHFFGEALEDSVGAVVLEALDTLESEGATFVDVELPSLRLAIPAGFTLLLADAGSSLRALVAERGGELHEATRRAVELGALMPSVWVDAAQRARGLLREQVRVAFRNARLDALVTPTLPRTSIPLDEMVIAVDLPRYIPFTLPWNLTGQPALTVPCGFTVEGLPVGLQVVGRPFGEAAVLGIGRAYEAVTEWSRRRPALPSLLG